MEAAQETTGRLDRGDGLHLAWARVHGARIDPARIDPARIDPARIDGAPAYGAAPTIVFLPGFRSDMTGDKATSLAAFAAERGLGMLRFDYSGHGASEGLFTDGTIGEWASDALTVIDRLTAGPLILVGSSMGGWIALLTALARRDRVVGLVGIAAAPDFTQRLMWDAMAPAERATLQRDGILHVPSQYGDPTPITLKLIEDGARHHVLTGPIDLHCPIRLLHGQADPDVPWELALTIARQVASTDVEVILVKDGDHRLSRPADLALLTRTVAALLRQDGA
jgi:pimeloyl-ACP methyl ester carboxylesterase